MNFVFGSSVTKNPIRSEKKQERIENLSFTIRWYVIVSMKRKKKKEKNNKHTEQFLLTKLSL